MTEDQYEQKTSHSEVNMVFCDAGPFYLSGAGLQFF